MVAPSAGSWLMGSLSRVEHCSLPAFPLPDLWALMLQHTAQRSRSADKSLNLLVGGTYSPRAMASLPSVGRHLLVHCVLFPEQI